MASSRNSVPAVTTVAHQSTAASIWFTPSFSRSIRCPKCSHLRKIFLPRIFPTFVSIPSLHEVTLSTLEPQPTTLALRPSCPNIFRATTRGGFVDGSCGSRPSYRLVPDPSFDNLLTFASLGRHQTATDFGGSNER